MEHATNTAHIAEQIVVDVTGWPEPDRRKLRAAIQGICDSLTTARLAAVTADHGWTKKTLDSLVSRLTVGSGADLAKTFDAAVRNGGDVLRDEVYRIAGYESKRSLKGFTRPVNRIVKEMRDGGEIPATAVEPFEPIYDDNIKGYQQAKGFRVPPAIVDLLTE